MFPTSEWPSLRRAEARALDAAQADREAGRSTLVLAHSSNEHLDELNASAQAIRAQEGELGAAQLDLTGRPYGLHTGDAVVVRAPLVHPDLGAVRNGVTAEVMAVDEPRERAELRLADGRTATWDRALLDRARVRVGYVSHPYPAQGRTTDTAHVIAERHATAEGSYVALTPVREHTTLYAGRGELDPARSTSRGQAISALAEQLGRSEPELPSILVPLAREQRIEREHDRETRPSHSSETERGPAQLALPSEAPDHAEELERLRGERDRLRVLIRPTPPRSRSR